MIRAEGVTVTFGGKRAVDKLSLTVGDHGCLGLVGPNGSGKTTLLRTLYGSLHPDAGQVLIDAAPLTSYRRRELAKKIAVVTQERTPDMPVSVADTVLLGRLPHLGAMNHATARDQEIVEKAMASVGVLDMARRDFAELSGGERQRTLIARALAQQTHHVLLDEPTNHLDIRFQHEILNLVAQLPGSSVVVLHDLNLAARYCDEVAVLDHGVIIAQGTPAEIFTPEILNPVYGIEIKRFDVDGELHLAFLRPTS